MHRQEFDIGDIVRVTEPTKDNGEIGLVTQKKRIHDLPSVTEDYFWHRDEYRCQVKLSTGESEWIRAKFLKIVSRAENS
tara:strand:- start:229 stop:465 length:237 start_codon:yes stop_codon:yes gene_type:complete